jgi:uncharacterized membrane protein YccC
MKADAEAALFSVKCFVAAMLAYYIALRIGLTRPYWAIGTVYLVSQPLAGAAVSKAIFRLLGTLLGGTAAVVLVPSFVNEPAILSAALALWVGLCLYVSLLDRTPRSYVFLLAGYTATIIGFPSVNVPGEIFNVAIVRVQEISIGIVCGGLIHGLIFPRTVTDRLLHRIDAILVDAERWSRDALAGTRDTTLDRDRRRLAADLADLHQVAAYLPFDTARLLPRARTVRAFQDRLSMVLPMAATVEDRLAELHADPLGVPAPIATLVAQIGDWLDAGVSDENRDTTAGELIAAARYLDPIAKDGFPAWRDLLVLSLLSRLAELVEAHRDCQNLRDQARTPTIRPLTPTVAELLACAKGHVLHRDHGLALRSALGTVVAIGLGCTFWIATAWTDGATAVLILSVCCALFGNVDAPAPNVFKYFLGSVLGVGMALAYDFVILPRATDFVTLAAVLAPGLLLMGSIMARPQLTFLSLGIVLTFPIVSVLGATNGSDFAAFANASLAILIGTGFAVVTVGLFQTVGSEHSIARLVRAGWRDVALRARGQARDTERWTSRMLDRVGMLAPRLAARRGHDDQPLLDALRDLRTGYVAGELDALGGGATPGTRALLARTLAGVADYFRALDPARHARPTSSLLADIDRSVTAFATEPSPALRRHGLILLTSLRRNLFPDAPAYAGVSG